MNVDTKHKCRVNMKTAKPSIKTASQLLEYDYSKPLQKTEDILEQIFDLQGKLNIRIIENMAQPLKGGSEEWLSMTATAIIHEAVELQNLTNWKWWKRPQGFDKEKAKEELIDIWHFVVSASIELGMKPDDILREYERKNQVNHERQDTGY